MTEVPPQGRSGTEAELDITIRTGAGAAKTLLAAFDRALLEAGVANFNLVRLSSVIPAPSRISRSCEPLPGRHGDRLFCVYAAAYADHPGDVAWAGLGWTREASGEGLFVEHIGGSEGSVREQIELSLADMTRSRGRDYGPVEMVLESRHCTDQPVCALVIAPYQVTPWRSM